MNSGNPGFYRGTTHDQMPFFANKERKMIESGKWPAEFEIPVDVAKVRIGVLRPWITKRTTELLGEEDEILVEYCISQLENPVDVDGNKNTLCPKTLAVNLSGFMAKYSAMFVGELWGLLLSAAENPEGIPQKLIEEKKLEQLAHKSDVQKAAEEIRRIQLLTEALAARHVKNTQPAEAQQEDQPTGDQPREDRPREDRPREDRPRENRPREDRAREDRSRDQRPRYGSRYEPPPYDRPREGGGRHRHVSHYHPGHYEGGRPCGSHEKRSPRRRRSRSSSWSHGPSVDSKAGDRRKTREGPREPSLERLPAGESDFLDDGPRSGIRLPEMQADKFEKRRGSQRLAAPEPQPDLHELRQKALEKLGHK